ncbi:Protein NUCLEAR FUSION DEFECTIVE 4 [Linum grandiflorum]
MPPNIIVKGGSRPPWVGLAAAVWVLVAAGNGYTFPLYSPALKSVMGLTQQQVTILGVANDIGESVGLLPGIACNKFPPWAVLSVGAVMCFLGYGLLWLTVSQIVSGLPYWLLWIALVIATNSNAWFGTPVLVTNMRNFPLSRGTVSGILKGYVGVSAAVYTVVYSMVLKDNATHFLLFLTIGIPITALLMMYFIRACTPASGEDSSVHIHFVFTQAASVLLAIYLLTTTIITDVFSLSNAVCYTLVSIMVVLMVSPLVIPVKMTLFPATSSKKRTPPVEGVESASTEPLLAYQGSFIENEDASDVQTLLAVGEGAVKKKRKPKRGEDFNFREALVKADFWLLWVTYFLGTGAGVTFLNNLAQIGVAFGLNDTTILLAIFSFCNFVGRLGSGVVSEHFVKSSTTPRTMWMTVAQIIMVVVFILFGFAVDGILYVATALLGVCYGILYSVVVPTTSELFGLEHFGIIYNFLQLGNPLGALLFSGGLAGTMYDIEASKQGSSTCIGHDCFKLTFFVLAGVCGLGTVLSVILTIRIKPVYQMLYAGGSFRVMQSSDH